MNTIKVSKKCIRDYEFYKSMIDKIYVNFDIPNPSYIESISPIDLYYCVESGIKIPYGCNNIEEYINIVLSKKCFMLQILSWAEGGFITKQERYEILGSYNAPEWTYEYSDKMQEKYFYKKYLAL